MGAGIPNIGRAATGDKVGVAFVELDLDETKYASGMKDAKKDLGIFDKDMQKIAGRVGKSFLAAGAAVGVGLGVAVRRFAEFEKSMKNVAAVSGATGKEYEKLKNFAVEMGSQTVFSAKEAGDAMYYLASAGLSVADQMKTTASVLDLAAATQSEMAATSSLIVNSLSAFELQADESRRVADLFATSIGNSQANLAKLSRSLPHTGQAFSDMKWSIESNVAALSLLYDRGLRAETAATGLRNNILTLIDPTAEAAAALEDMGLSIEELNPQANSLVDIVRKLEQAGFDTADSVKIFGKEANALAVLAGTGADKLEDFEKSLIGSAGAAEKMKDIQLDSLHGDLKLLSSAADAAAISFGEALSPAIRAVARGLTEVTSKFNELPKSTRNLVAYSAAAGSSLAIIGGGLTLIVAQLPGAIAGVKLLGGALSAVSWGPIGLAIAGVGAAIAAVAWGINEYKKARKDVFFEQEMKAISNNINMIEKGIKETEEAIAALEKAKETWGPHPAYIKNLEKLNKQLTSYRKELWHLRGGIGDVALVTKGAEEGIAGIGDVAGEASGTVAELARKAALLAVHLVELNASNQIFLDQFDKFPTTLDKATAAIGRMNEATGGMNDLIKPSLDRPVGGQFALVIPGKIDLPLNALERDIEEIEQKGMTIAPVSIDLVDLKEALRLASELQNSLQAIDTGFLLTPKLPTTEEKLNALTEAANEFRESMDLRPKVERPIGGLFALQLPGMAGTDDQRTVAPSEIVEKELQETLKLEKFYTGLRKEVALRGLKDAEGRSKDLKHQQKVTALEREKDLDDAIARERQALEKASEHWRRFTADIENATTGLFEDLMDPSILDKWDNFWRSLANAARRHISELLTSGLFDQLANIGQGPGAVAPQGVPGVTQAMGGIPEQMKGVQGAGIKEPTIPAYSRAIPVAADYRPDLPGGKPNVADYTRDFSGQKADPITAALSMMDFASHALEIIGGTPGGKYDIEATELIGGRPVDPGNPVLSQIIRDKVTELHGNPQGLESTTFGLAFPTMANLLRKTIVADYEQYMSQIPAEHFPPGTTQAEADDIEADWGLRYTPPEKYGIYGLKSGGIVREPTIAMIGEAGAEAVVPLTEGAWPDLANLGKQLEGIERSQRKSNRITADYIDRIESLQRAPAYELPLRSGPMASHARDSQARSGDTDPGGGDTYITIESMPINVTSDMRNMSKAEIDRMVTTQIAPAIPRAFRRNPGSRRGILR